MLWGIVYDTESIPILETLLVLLYAWFNVSSEASKVRQHGLVILGGAGDRTCDPQVLSLVLPQDYGFTLVSMSCSSLCLSLYIYEGVLTFKI